MTRLSLLSILLLLSCASPDESSIRSNRKLSNNAIALHKIEDVATFWTNDISVVTSRNAHNDGIEANTNSFQKEFDTKPDVVYERITDKVEVFTPWNMASEYGHWKGTWTDGTNKIRISGSYYAKWLKVNNDWRIRAEIYTPTACEGGAFCESIAVK